jgi:hypothetical protein
MRPCAANANSSKKHLRGLLESDSMLAKIHRRFPLIPFEEKHPANTIHP